MLGTSLTIGMANQAQATVLGLLIYKLTKSELDLGFLGLAQFTPAFLLVAVTGSVADRFDRRRVTSIGATFNAIVALVIAWYVRHPHGLSTTPIFLLVLAFGVGQATLSPALRSIPPAMVANEGVPWLVARRSIAQQSATILGPLLGGFLYGIGVWVALVGVAACSAIGAVSITTVRIPRETTGSWKRGRPEEGSSSASGAPGSKGIFHEALQGLRFVRAQPILLGAISLDLFAVLFGGAVTLLPAIAVHLHVGAVGLGWLRAAVGIGAGLATLRISIRPIQRKVGPVLFTVVILYGAWTIILGLAHSYVLAFIAILALSAADAVSVFIRSTLVPLATPPAMRGRVLAVENVFIGASNQLGGFESGAVGQLLGTTTSIVGGGIVTLLVALTWSVLFAPLRRIDRFPTPPLPASEVGDAADGSP
jgi:MFS family permease